MSFISPKIYIPRFIVNSNYMTSLFRPKTRLLLRFDGASKGNPGLAGAGAVLYRQEINYDKYIDNNEYENPVIDLVESEEIWSNYKFLGEKTNNQAEYSGLILGLEYMVNQKITSLTVEGDSLLVINQMTYKYKCASPNLIELHNEAKKLERKIDNIQYHYISRNYNKRADELANLAVKNR